MPMFDIERDVYTKETAAVCGIDESALRSRITKIMDATEGEFLKEAEKKRKRVYSEKDSRDVRPKGIIEAQRMVLSLAAYNGRVLKSVFSVISPDEFEKGVYRTLAERIYSDSLKGVKSEPADMVSCFETLEEQNAAAAVFALKYDVDDIRRLEKAVTENVRLIKKNYTDVLLASAVTAEEIKKLIEEKRKLDELNITISDS